MQEARKITCVNNAGFVQKFRIVSGTFKSGWSDTYPISESETVDLCDLNLDPGAEVTIEVKAVLGRTKVAESSVSYNPISENAVVYRTTGTTLSFQIKLEGE